MTHIDMQNVAYKPVGTDVQNEKKHPQKISEKFQPVWLFINQIEFDSIPLKCEQNRIFNDVYVKVGTVTSERHVRH